MEIVDCLLDNGADINSESVGKAGTAIRKTSYVNDSPLVKLLLAGGAVVNSQTPPAFGTAL